MYQEITKANIPLFLHLSEQDIRQLLTCTFASIHQFQKGELICWNENPNNRIGIVLAGSVTIARDDESGYHFILANVENFGLFGLSMSLSPITYEDITIYAATNCKTLLLDTNKVIHGCNKNCNRHMQLLKNLIYCLAQKNMTLVQKQCHMSYKSLRKKITSYLMEQSRLSNSLEFDITLNRQELAEYLGIDRSALSAELSKMKKEQIIDYKYNHFIILKS